MQIETLFLIIQPISILKYLLLVLNEYIYVSKFDSPSLDRRMHVTNCL